MQKPLLKPTSDYWSGWGRKIRKFSGGTALGAALLLGGGLYSGQANAQIINNYDFSASSGTYTPLGASATQLPLMKADTYISPSIPIGFTFNFDGVNYTNFRASSNGFISFNTSSSSETTNDLANSTSRPIVAPLWDDHDGNATGGVSNASYEVTGTAGSQVFTFEWRNWEWNYGSSAPVISFQVKLYEGTNKIEFVYRPESGAVSSGSASIGIAGVGAGNFMSLNNTTANATASTSTETTSINAKPAAGQIFTFTRVTPSALDVMANGLVPITGCSGPNRTVQVTIKNNGTAAINFATNPVTVTASGTIGTTTTNFPAAVVNTGTLAPGATQNVTVSSTYNMSTAGTYSFNASATTTGDGRTQNDAMAPANVVITNNQVSAPAALPQSIDFTGFDGSNLATIATGWSEASGATPSGTTSNWTNDDFANVTSHANGISAKSNIYSTARRDWMIGPKVLATATTVLKYDIALTGYAATNASTLGSDDEVKVMVSTDCGATFTPVRTYTSSSTISNTGQSETINLGTYAGQNIIVAFYTNSGTVNDAQDVDLFIDKIFLGTPPSIDMGLTTLVAPVNPACYTASQTVTVTIKNFATAPIDFALNPAIISVAVSGAVSQPLTTTINTGTLAPNATMNVNVGTLNMTTTGTYTFNSTIAVASDGNAANNTLPAETRVVTPVVTVPQTVNFTGFTGSNLTNIFPNWREGAGATLPAGTSSGWSNKTGLGGASNVTAYMNIYTTGSGQNEWIVGPKVAATSSTFFVFKAAITDWNNLNPDANGMDANDKVQVMVSTDCGATFTPVYTMDATNTANLTNVLTEQRVSLGSFAGQNIIVALFATGGATSGSSDYDFHVDDLSIQLVPAVDLGVTALASPATFNGCYGNARNVSVTIRNYGSAPLNFATNNATLTVNVTGAATQPFTFPITTNALNNGNPLAVGATMNVPVGNLNMSALGAYTFNASIATSGDTSATNNAMSPVTITVAAPVAGTASASIPTICQSGSTTLNLSGFNGGDVQWQSATSATGPFTNITGATNANFTTPTLTQTTYYQAVISCGTANATSNVVTVTVNNPAITASAGASRCGAGTVALSATPSAGATINWFSSATGGTSLATGNTYSPNVSATTTYYAEASTGISELAGKMSTNGADGTNTGGGLIFNASSPFTLDSVVVYSALTSGGALTVNLTDANGTILQTTTVTLPGVTTRTAIKVPLNFSVPAGTGLRLVQGTSLGLYRDYSSTAGISYPYTSPSQLVTITDGTLAGYYYFFYRWSISTKCVAPTRTAVVATVTPGPATPTITAGGPTTLCSGGSVTLTGASTTTGVTYQWQLNGTAIPGATSATYTASASGSYTVSATNSSCSSISAATTVTVNPAPAVPTITAGGNTAICSGTTVALSAASTTTGATYEWFLNGTAIPGANSAAYTANAAGNYTVVASLNGCSSAASTATVVSVNPTPATPTVTRSGNSGQTLSSSATTGNQWRLNGNDIAGATAQTYNTTANGSYTVVVTDGGCESTPSAAVNITNTGMSADLAGMNVSIYPNPNNGSFNVKLTGYQQEATLTLYSLTGQLIVTENVKAGQEVKAMNVKNLAAGTYLLKVISEKGTQVSRLVVE